MQIPDYLPYNLYGRFHLAVFTIETDAKLFDPPKTLTDIDCAFGTIFTENR